MQSFNTLPAYRLRTSSPLTPDSSRDWKTFPLPPSHDRSTLLELRLINVLKESLGDTIPQYVESRLSMRAALGCCGFDMGKSKIMPKLNAISSETGFDGSSTGSSLSATGLSIGLQLVIIANFLSSFAWTPEFDYHENSFSRLDCFVLLLFLCPHQSFRF